MTTGAPAFLRGRNLNNKLNIAFIACGGRADREPERAHHQAGRGRRGPRPRRKRRGAASGREHHGPLRREPERRGCRGPAIPESQEVQRFPAGLRQPERLRCRHGRTAEHTHAFATYLALTHGKHVYCEKPLTYNIWEARLIRETAAKYPKLSTQTGNQGHASPARRKIKEMLMAGVIGPVREVHVWADRAWGLQDAASAAKYDKPHGFYNGIQIVERFKEEMPVPPNMHWDLWIGPAPVRPFHATYFPGPRWYRWWDFGNGTMSDLGGHDNDVPFTVLDIRQPLTIEAVSPNGPAHTRNSRRRR